MADVYGLSERDKALIQSVINRVLRTAPHLRTDAPDTIPGTPDLYLARANATIPPLTPDSGTGTDTWPEPGKGICTIYQLVENVLDSPELQLTENTTQTVYNPTAKSISVNDWIVVARDKFGDWFIINVFDPTDWNRCKGHLIDDLNGEATAWVNAVSVIRGTNPTKTTAELLLVYNPHTFDGLGNSDIGTGTGTGTGNDAQDGALARFEWCKDDDRWEIYQLDWDCETP